MNSTHCFTALRHQNNTKLDIHGDANSLSHLSLVFPSRSYYSAHPHNHYHITLRIFIFTTLVLLLCASSSSRPYYSVQPHRHYHITLRYPTTMFYHIYVCLPDWVSEWQTVATLSFVGLTFIQLSRFPIRANFNCFGSLASSRKPLSLLTIMLSSQHYLLAESPSYNSNISDCNP